MSHIKIPSDGAKITVNNDGTYNIPDNPIITFIEGDGIGPDLWAASVRVFDAAVEKAFKGSKKISWAEVYAGEKALDITNDNESLIGTILLGNNIVNILATSLATAYFVKLFGDKGIFLATFCMTVLILVFSELLPKTYAINNPETAARRVAPLVLFFIYIFSPIIIFVRVIKIELTETRYVFDLCLLINFDRTGSFDWRWFTAFCQ